MKNKILIGITFSLLISCSVAAELVCDEKQVEQGIMPAIFDCANVEIGIEDKKLNIIYKEIIMLSNEKEKSFIQQSQRAWLKLIENDQQFVYLIYGQGQYAQLRTLEVYLEALKVRVDQLKNYKSQLDIGY